MHTDLSPHLHSEQCNEYIKLLQECRDNKPFTKFFGSCNSEYHKMTKCLKDERLARRKRNYDKSLETKEKLRRLFEEDRERKRQESQSN